MIVLDASALLALFNREAGWEVVARSAASSDSTISSVNYAEVLQKRPADESPLRKSTRGWTPSASL